MLGYFKKIVDNNNKMIVFLVKEAILQYMADYLHHVQSYLGKFDLSADVVSYQPRTVLPDLNKYKVVIFVQSIDPTIFRRLTAPKTATVPPPNPRRPQGSFQTRRPAQQRGTRALVSNAEPTPTPQPLPKTVEKPEPEPTPQPTTAEKPEPKCKIFLLNTEQATMTGYISRTVADINRYNVPVIDYSMENIALLKRKLPGTKFIHLPFPVSFNPVTPMKNGVISLMSSLHRRKVCNSLGVPVADFNNKWGQDRDQMIKASKVLINIHYKPGAYGIFESIRCYHALEMRTLVISEPSVSQNNVLLKDYIIFVPSGQMAAKLKDVLANYQVYYDKCFSEERIQELEERFERVYRKSIDEIINI